MAFCKREYSVLAASCILVVLLAVVDLCLGSVKLDLLHLDGSSAALLLRFRLPRALTAMLAGAGLSMCGLQMQSVFRNPLADPHILGVSGAASLGAAIALILFGGTGIAAGAGAFAGAAVASVMIVGVSVLTRKPGVLLITGVLLGYVFSAGVGILQFSSSEHALKLYYSWASGTFSSTSVLQVGVMAAALIVSFCIALCVRGGLDVLLFGEEYAASVGVSSKRIKIVSLLSCCVFTSIATAFCGPVGFVGIIGPHIARFISGKGSHSITLPLSMACGAVLSLGADCICAALPWVVPCGSMMALLGIPMILVLLLRSGAISGSEL